MRRADLHGEAVETIYFGGGTPSLLMVAEIRDILTLIRDCYEIASGAEITLEANPDTLSLEYLADLREIGVNRLSIGIQSFFDDDLKYLNRRHQSEHARQCLGWTKEVGFENVSVDLIYGLPTADGDRWNRNLDLFFEAGIPHLSAYALTLEPNAVLTKQIEMGKALPVNEEDAIRDYEILCRCAAEQGFLHYEISNFCRPGLHSRHNANYWFGVPYAGFGPSAHSFDGDSRQWNISSVERYINSNTVEKEHLSPEQKYDEYVMLRLRTMWGIDLKYIKREMGERFSMHCEQQSKPLVDQGRISQIREFLFLDDAQMLFADGIAETLFW